MQTPDNLARAARIAPHVGTYRWQHDEHEHFDVVLADMLADLMHWADAYGEDFDAALTTARMNYSAETAGE